MGTRYQEKDVLGSYIKTASHLRQILLLIICGTGILLAIAFRKRIEPYGHQELILLSLAMLLTVQFQAWASYYEIPLLLNGKLVSFYAPQIAAAALRIVSSFVLYYMHWISATTVIMANTLSIVLMGVSYRIMARRWIQVPHVASREHGKEMIRFLVPLLPGTVYQALQGQISLFLIAVFGHVGQIAEVAAAGRIGQLFLLLNSSNSVLIGPYFAKSERSVFRNRYVKTMSAVLVVGLMAVASAKLFPGAYLLLLGARYSNLTPQVQLVIYASAIGYLTGAMWTIAVTRKWIFWWSGSMQVIVLTLVQLACVMFLPLNTSEGVLKMNIYTAFGALSVQIMHVFRGFSVHAKAEAAEAIAS